MFFSEGIWSFLANFETKKGGYFLIQGGRRDCLISLINEINENNVLKAVILWFCHCTCVQGCQIFGLPIMLLAEFPKICYFWTKICSFPRTNFFPGQAQISKICSNMLSEIKICSFLENYARKSRNMLAYSFRKKYALGFQNMLVFGKKHKICSTWQPCKAKCGQIGLCGSVAKITC